MTTLANRPNTALLDAAGDEHVAVDAEQILTVETGFPDLAE